MDTWYFRAVCLLGYSDEKFWKSTLRQLFCVFEKYCVWHGYIQPKENNLLAGDIDDLAFEEVN